MTVSSSPSLPNTHSPQLALLEWKSPPRVLSTQLVLPASTANWPSAQISSVGMTIHCDRRRAVDTVQPSRDLSGVTIRMAE